MNSRFATHGPGTSAVEVTNISAHGFWVFLADRELFLSFRDFPWFAEAPVGKIMHVVWPSPDHLYWPDLDLDVSIQSIERPEDFPLVSGPPS